MACSTEAVVLIVCGSIPTLKPIYDMGHDSAKSALSYISTGRYSSGKPGASLQPYSSGSAQKPSYSDPRFAHGSYKLDDGKRQARRSSKLAHRATSEAHWIDNDDHALLEMGKINVVNEWEVNHERRDSGNEPGSYAFSESKQPNCARSMGDDAV